MFNFFQNFTAHRKRRLPYRSIWEQLHIDLPLLIAFLLLGGIGLFILYSASGQSIQTVSQQAAKGALALALMVVLAQIPPGYYRVAAPWLYGFCLLMLVMVLALGVVSKGSQRWLNLGLFRFQPSEIMKLALPLMLAWYFNQGDIPPTFKRLMLGLLMIAIPAALVAKQPDLGTALMITFGGVSVVLLAGISWPLLVTGAALFAASLPVAWHFLHDYQKKRVLTLFNPESDPLGAGYHIIQSKIAIGSGGLWGKGWLQGTQSHLSFLPEHATDFIFAVSSEEFGLIGAIVLISIFLFILCRGLYITVQAQDTFSRLIAGGVTLLFFISAIVNMSMVCGLLPVVGVPLPLVSYGGTAMVTFIASFGIVMSVHANRRMLGS